MRPDTEPNRPGQWPMVAQSSESRDSAPAICLLDDDLSVLKATGRLLRAAGLEVKTFSEPHGFLQHVHQYQPRVAVIDIWMPMMNGLEVQARLRDVSPATRVIVLTSKDDPAVRAKAMDAGAHAFFLKPVPGDEFLDVIGSAASNN